MTRICSLALAIVALLICPVVATAGEKSVKSSDGSLSIMVPEEWGEMSLNGAAEIQVGSEEQGAYLIVLIEAKEDLFGWTLQRHSHVTRGTLLSDVDLPQISGPKT